VGDTPRPPAGSILHLFFSSIIEIQLEAQFFFHLRFVKPHDEFTIDFYDRDRHLTRLLYQLLTGCTILRDIDVLIGDIMLIEEHTGPLAPRSSLGGIDLNLFGTHFYLLIHNENAEIVLINPLYPPILGDF